MCAEFDLLFDTIENANGRQSTIESPRENLGVGAERRRGAAAQLADIRGNIGIGIWNFQREVRAWTTSIILTRDNRELCNEESDEEEDGGGERENERFPRYSRRER